jgi:tetratricopeptide (TPR) repeat protein
MTTFRAELLAKAKRFYLAFLEQNPRSSTLQRDIAYAHVRLGQINRMAYNPDDAAAEFRQAIGLFRSLDRSHGTPEYRQALANSYNWLGETLRPIPDRSTLAIAAYDSALRVQTALVAEHPGRAVYRQELARTYSNRGILRFANSVPGDSLFLASASDFGQAIRLLEPLVTDTGVVGPAVELARTYNNLGSLRAEDDASLTEAGELYERAITVGERLVAGDPENREFRLELAKFRNNQADRLRRQMQFGPARDESRRALELLEMLARPTASLGIELADAHNLRGRIFATAGSDSTTTEYARALRLYDALRQDRAARRLASFHERFGDLLDNLVDLSVGRRNGDDARRLLAEAVRLYVPLADSAVAAGSALEARMVLDNLARIRPALAAPEQAAVTALGRRLGVNAARRP